MRLDHIAYRVRNRYKTSEFLKEAFGYSIGTEFQIEFDDGSKADCLALEPPEKRPTTLAKTPASLSTQTTIIWVSNLPFFPGMLYADFALLIILKSFLCQ